jgi:hypothetical protein
MWKLKNNRGEGNGSYISSSVFKLLSLLESAEGITRDNVETLIIHQHVGEGYVREVLAIENKDSSEATKPRVNLPAVIEDTPKPIIQAFYKAYPAQSMKRNTNG